MQELRPQQAALECSRRTDYNVLTTLLGVSLRHWAKATGRDGYAAQFHLRALEHHKLASVGIGVRLTEAVNVTGQGNLTTNWQIALLEERQQVVTIEEVDGITFVVVEEVGDDSHRQEITLTSVNLLSELDTSSDSEGVELRKGTKLSLVLHDVQRKNTKEKNRC